MDATDSPPPEARHVLLVDDTVTPRTLLQVHLMGMGFTFDVASDGVEALQKARSKKPHLVISDVRMPKMDGIELCRAFRDDPNLRRVPVVLLTSAKEDRIRKAGQAAGASAFLSKPVDVPELRRVVDQVFTPKGRRRR